jgi:hypothetical protein
MELLEYKKVIGFTKMQQNAFKTLESYEIKHSSYEEAEQACLDKLIEICKNKQK